jgi:hypothetical protein
MQNDSIRAARKWQPPVNVDEDDLPKSERKRLHREDFLRGQA